jgi:hypothetical protein
MGDNRGPQPLFAICPTSSEGNPVVHSRHLSRLGLTVLLGLVAALVVSLPAAAVPAVGCGSVGNRGKRYNVRAHLLACSSARTAARNYLASGKKPRGYSCVKYNPKITKVVFNCTTRSRGDKDGLKGFSASRT